MFNDKKTGELLGILKKTSSEKELDDYISDESMNDYKQFAEYFFSLESVKEKKQSQIVNDSLLKKSYAYEILSFECKKRPKRERLIALMIAGGLNIDEVQRGLEICGAGTLYARDRRDAIIIFGINHKKKVLEINEMLVDRGFEALDGTKDD